MLLQVQTASAPPVAVELLAKEQVALLWPEMYVILEEKAEDFLTVYSEEEIFKLACSGIIDVWIGRRGGQIDGFVLAAWEVHARAKYYHILGGFGDNLKFYLSKGLEQMEKYAYVLGAVELIIEGRSGWLRLLKPRGYRARTIKLRKNLRKALGN